MKKLMIAAAAVFAAASAPAAIAQEVYGNVGVSGLDGDGATLTAATLRGGAFITENFGAEAEFSVGLGGESIQGVALDLETSFIGYAVGRLPMGDSTDLIGRVGYGSATIEGRTGGGSVDVDIDGFAFGVGIQHFFTESFGVRGDITRFEADEPNLDGGLDIYTISGVYRFKVE